MEKSFVYFWFLLLTMAASCGHPSVENEESQKDSLKIHVNNPDSGLSHLLDDEGEYPNKIAWFDKPELKRRLIKLLGPEYPLFIKDWNTETAIELKEGILHTSGCKKEACMENSYDLFLDPLTNNITIYNIKNGRLREYFEIDKISMPKRFAKNWETKLANAGLKDSSSLQKARELAGYLRNNLLHKELANLKPQERKFHYDVFDLNEDGKNEYLITFLGANFCGNSGCLFFLVNEDGIVITRFIKTKLFYILPNKTHGWHDLVAVTNARFFKLNFDGSSYPEVPEKQMEVSKPHLPELQKFGERGLHEYSF